MKSIVVFASFLCWVWLFAAATKPSAAEPLAEPLATESLSCSGSSRCGSLGAASCDSARRKIQANTRYYTGSTSRETGVCSGNCGLFVSGQNCALYGSEMFTAYDQLRNHGCRICGVKTFDDGCKFKMDYVTGC